MRITEPTLALLLKEYAENSNIAKDENRPAPVRVRAEIRKTEIAAYLWEVISEGNE